MDINTLKEYLDIILDLEKNILLRKQLITSLSKNANQLGKRCEFTAPTKPQEWLPPATVQDNYEISDETPNTSIGCLSALLWIPVYLVITLMLEVIGGRFYYRYMPFIILGSLIIAVLLSFQLRKYIAFRARVRQRVEAMQRQDEYIRRAEEKREQTEKAWRESMSRYHLALRAYQQDVANDEKRVRLENEQKKLLRQEIEKLTRSQTESEQRLAQIYAKNIVFPKYQNFVAISSLYEYICAGRCSTLEGYEGAYNIYETEVRLDRIITQLDQVIAHLDAIRNNQFVLFTAIQEVNQQCAQILESLHDIDQKSRRILEATWNVSDNIVLQMDSINGQADQISTQLRELQKTSALTAYHTERNQRELAYMNRMDYLAGRNDEVFWNHPPV